MADSYAAPYGAHLTSFSKKVRILEANQKILRRIWGENAQKKLTSDVRRGPDSVTLYAHVRVSFWKSHFVSIPL